MTLSGYWQPLSKVEIADFGDGTNCSSRRLFCFYFSCVRGTKTFFRLRAGKFSIEAPNLVLHDIDGGPILRKLRHPMPDFNGPIRFDNPFIAKQHEALMRKKTDLSHLHPGLQEKIYSVIREYWSLFDERGVFIPVKNYECVIDTGNAQPIAIKKILYGKRETAIMRKCISALAKVDHIRQITDGSWLFKALLAAKPHQEHVINIEDFVWRFGVNYVPLNGVTRVIIPHPTL